MGFGQEVYDLLTDPSPLYLLQLLPNRVDWTGKEHPRTYQNLVSGAKVFYDLIFPHTELNLNFPHFVHLPLMYIAPAIAMTVLRAGVSWLPAYCLHPGSCALCWGFLGG